MISIASDFEIAWEHAQQIDGWLSQYEAAALFSAAQQVPPGGLIVEVGSFCGRSTRLLAETGRRLLAIDPLGLGQSVGKELITPETVECLKRVVNECPNVTWRREARVATALPHSIEMLYIDGCHRYPQPRDDFLHFESVLVAAACIAFHDYQHDSDPGVTESVMELEGLKKIRRIGTYGYMYIGEKL